MHWIENEALFIRLLREGYDYECIVAERFRGYGLTVDHPPLTIRKDVGDIYKWAQSRDMIVAGKKIEVKSRKYHFSSHRDFQFPDVYVESAEGYDVKEIKPFAYVIISKFTKQTFVFGGGNPDLWNKRVAWDGVRKINQLSYACPMNRCSGFQDLIEILLYEEKRCHT